MRYMLLITLLFIISCDNIEPPRCQIESWIIDDCGICRECELEECNWNETMNTCGGCDDDLSSCTGCMDPEAINTELDMIIHDESTCDYDNFINVLSGVNTSIEPDYKIIRPGRAAYFVNNLDYLITVHLNDDLGSLSISPNQQGFILLEEEGLIQYNIIEENLSGIILIQSYE